MTPYFGPCNFGPCNSGQHPEFGWGQPCPNDATEYVSVSRDAGDFTCRTLMRLCGDHAEQATELDGFGWREPLRPGAVTYERPVAS
jgi:hypothetical protein